MPAKPICSVCKDKPAALKRPKNGALICSECFFMLFETEVHQTILSNNLFQKGDRVACGASGGKDSTVLMHLMKTLNDRYQYGIELILVSIDEGIVGYRDDSLLTVHRNSEFYQLPLKILSYKELYGWTMDEIVKEIGSKNNCTFCGVFRRQALDRGASIVGANKIVTGHNADDTAETILMNILRSDAPRLQRCASTTTESADSGQISRVKPLKFAYEKEIVLYAHFKKLDYFTTECTYSKEAFRGNVRTLVKDLEAIDPRCINDVIYSGERLPSAVSSTPAAAPTATANTVSSGGSAGTLKQSMSNDNVCCNGSSQAAGACSSAGCETAAASVQEGRSVSTTTTSTNNKCRRCGYLTSQELCRACVLLSALNRGKAKIALRETGGKDHGEDNDNAAAEMRPCVDTSPAVISHKNQGVKV